eukprot:1848704-Karenia_brevis.AAC.1
MMMRRRRRKMSGWAGRSRHSGKVLIPAAMAYDYGLVDERGVRSPPISSVKPGQFEPLVVLAQSWTILAPRGE